MDTAAPGPTHAAADGTNFGRYADRLPNAYVRKDRLMGLVASKRGSASLHDYADSDLIPNTADLTVSCAGGHTWASMAACVEDWCEICKLLSVMNRFDPNIVCMQRQYAYGQLSFEFMCGHGHRFVACARTCKNGCRSCYVLEIARKKHCTDGIALDIMCVNVDEDSKLRFHCGKLRHDPKCANLACVSIRESAIDRREWAPGCKNLVPCDQDFYATPRQIKHEAAVLKCSANHRWPSRKETYLVVRMLETLFDARFDDTAYGVDFTALSIKMGVACTHMADKKPAKCLIAAKKWCEKYGVRFAVIPADIVDAPKVGVELAKQLSFMGLFSDKTPLMITQGFRTKMHTMDAAGKLFADRCVYGA